MRTDQGREDSGRFGSLEENRFGEKLENLIACKVTASEARELAIMFDQHRKLFNWQTNSDMIRQMVRDGLRQAVKTLTKPNPELVQMLAESDQMEAARGAVRTHKHHEQMVDTVADTIMVLKQERDYGKLRRILQEFKDRTRTTKDPVIRRRRQEEFESRGWALLLRDLTKSAEPVKFINLEDEEE
jgi:hypothetical protein